MKEYQVNGRKITVENGIITVDGKKITDHVYPHQVREIKDAPKMIRDHLAKNSINTDGKVYVDCSSGLTIDREIAEEAVRQTEEFEAARDPRNIIEGYTELKAAYADAARYARELEKSYETSIGPNPVTVKQETVVAKYPRAAAYVEAENYSNASNYAKSAAGTKATGRIIAGEDYQVVIAEMKESWMIAAQKAVDNS